jgi:hypothetical protein
MPIFSQNKPDDEMTERELLMKLLLEVDEVKRYAANAYANTDTEMAEVRDLVKRMEPSIRQFETQLNKIERFERDLNDLESLIKTIERKIR